MGGKINQSNDLLISNVEEIMKLQAFLKAQGNNLQMLYDRIEVDDPAKKDVPFTPIRRCHDELWNAVDRLQKNAENLLILNDITLQQ